jgi:glycosyltransferase involved in cell wall biosynthesis
MPADGALRLLSIGRYCHPKNFDNVPDICRRIVESGLNVRWYIIGYGNDAYIRRAIDEAGMQEHVIILGKKSNPYPYIKACDIYVQPSRYEGKSVTVREAQVLCKPVIITAYPTANSQMQHGVDGIIVPLDNEGCAHGMVNAITHPEQLQTITQYLHTHDYGNEHEVEKIYELITQPQ